MSLLIGVLYGSLQPIIDDDKAFEAYRKFFYDNGLGKILDGIAHGQLNSIQGICYGGR